MKAKIPIALIAFAFSASAQIRVESQPSTDKTAVGMTPTRSSNVLRQLHDRYLPFQNLLSQPAAQRRNGLEQLLGNEDDSLAALAARQLVVDNSPSHEGLIVSHIAGWHPRNQLIVLEELRLHFGVDLEIARAVLSRTGAIDPQSYNTMPSQPVDLAAILIARTPVPSDSVLIASALQNSPQSRGLWLAAVSLGLNGPEQRTLAYSTWQNGTLPLTVRSGAALLLAPINQSAEEFVESSILSAVRTSSSHATGPGTAAIDLFRTLAMIGLIEFLPTASSQGLLSELKDVDHPWLKPAIQALTMVKTPQRVNGQNIPPDLLAKIQQYPGKLFIGY